MRQIIYLIPISVLLMVLLSGGVHPRATCGNSYCEHEENCFNCEADCRCLVLFDSGGNVGLSTEEGWYHSEINFTPNYDMVITAIFSSLGACDTECSYNAIIYNEQGNKLGETYETYPPFSLDFIPSLLPEELFPGDSPVKGTLNKEVTLIANTTYRIYQGLSKAEDPSHGVILYYMVGHPDPVRKSWGWYELNYVERGGTNKSLGPLSFRLKGYLVEKCGNDICDSDETCATCPADCDSCVCGDGTCDTTETCATCPIDCGPCIRCGNSICDDTETCQSCPVDCGNEILFDSGRGTGPYDKMSYSNYNSEVNFTPYTDMVITAIQPDFYFCAYPGTDAPPHLGDPPLPPKVSECYFRATLSGTKGNTKGVVEETYFALWNSTTKTDNEDLIPGSIRGTLDTIVSLKAGTKYVLSTYAGSTQSVGIYTAGGESPKRAVLGWYELNYDSSDNNPPPYNNRGPISFQLKGCLLNCGDGICGSDETCAICPKDCGSCDICGDGICTGAETCATCPEDCHSCDTCGDGICTGAETCATCPEDCRSCDICGDGICNGADTCETCPRDCGYCVCGDGSCNDDETCKTCPEDCGCQEGKVCVDGECVTCEEKALSPPYCSGQSVVRDYQTSDCKIETRELAKCLYGCLNRTCLVQCNSEDDCPLDQFCERQRCRQVKCECGYPKNHQCYDYECCSDNDCGDQMVCSQYIHECIPKVSCVPVMKNGPANDKLDILFIGAEYSDADELEELIMQTMGLDENWPHTGFFDVEPFKSNKDKFNVWMVPAPDYTTTRPPLASPERSPCITGCWYVDPFSGGAKYKGMCPYADQAIILFRNSAFRSCAWSGMQWVSVSCAGDEPGRLVLHESGHTIGELRDEYVEPAFGDAPGRPNCADTRQQAEEWWGDLVGVEDVGYYEGCSYTLDNYRPTRNSIMRSLSSDSFGPVNERALKEVLEDFK